VYPVEKGHERKQEQGHHARGSSRYTAGAQQRVSQRHGDQEATPVQYLREQ
jgi:hypothetical protein